MPEKKHARQYVHFGYILPSVSVFLFFAMPIQQLYGCFFRVIVLIDAVQGIKIPYRINGTAPAARLTRYVKYHQHLRLFFKKRAKAEQPVAPPLFVSIGKAATEHDGYFVARYAGLGKVEYLHRKGHVFECFPQKRGIRRVQRFVFVHAF